MPPKTTINKEDVIKAAFELMRKEGLNGFSARNVGKQLGCSTQPIYSLFKNMRLLENEAIEYAAKYTTQKYLALNGEKQTFLDTGVGYVQMALEEKALFNLLYNSGKVHVDMRRNIYPVNAVQLIEDMKKYDRLKGLNEEVLYDLLNDMWVFTHGLAVLLCNCNDAFNENYIRARIQRVGDSIIERILKEAIET
ncbi:MAG: hypothetical protein JXR76_32795 [Deltaproteobacteria bacterium]|nr:hypothetical protein [Deltaproteobacteria bacterium]